MLNTISNERLRYSGVPSMYVGFSHFDDRAKDYRDSLEKSFSLGIFRGSWLILTGNAGTGKTSTACSILLTALEYRLGHFITAPGFMRELKDGFGSYSPDQVASRYANTKMLVLDDFGKEKMTDWTCEQMFALLDSRFARNLPTIITTNYGLGGLLEKIEHATDEETARAFGSRLRADRNTIIEFKGRDMRWKQ